MRFRGLLPAWSRRRTFPLLGALLALGAPLGLLLLRCLEGQTAPTPTFVLATLRGDPLGYGYLTLGTLVVFVLLGRTLGAREDALAETSITDPLTRLYNRRHIDARLAEELSRSSRHGTDVSLLLLDVDHLKEINDRAGHEAGDNALIFVADTLRKVCRVTDLPARYGGDEFLVLLPATNAERAVELAERLRAVMASASTNPGVTVSIGIADVAHAEAARAEALFEAADAALYAAKKAGRDRVIIAPGVRALTYAKASGLR